MVAHSQRDDFGATGHPKFGQNVADMGFDGGGADKQLLGYLGIIKPFDQQREHGLFPFG